MAKSQEEKRAAATERQRQFRARQKALMNQDPEYAASVKAKKAKQDKKRLERRQNDPTVREAYNEYMREYHAKKSQEDPEYVERKREKDRRFYWNHRDSRLAAARQWAENNDRSEYNLEWARANPDKIAERDRRRKALLKGATEIESFTKPEVWERDQGICGICLEPADPTDWHLDHVIPLSKGGSHTFRNVQVSHPRCNLSKKDKIL